MCLLLWTCLRDLEMTFLWNGGRIWKKGWVKRRKISFPSHSSNISPSTEKQRHHQIHTHTFNSGMSIKSIFYWHLFSKWEHQTLNPYSPHTLESHNFHSWASSLSFRGKDWMILTWLQMRAKMKLISSLPFRLS